VGGDEGEFGRPPPSDVGRERLLLSAMMNAPADAIDDAIRAGLVERDFYRPAHEVIAHALICMWAAEAPVDPATVADWITRDGDLQALGGYHDARMYLFGLWEMREVGAAAGHHAAKIHKLAVKRREVELGQRMIQRGYAPDPDSADADIAQAEAELAALAGVLAEPDYPLTPDRFIAQAAERAGRPPGVKRRPRWVIPGMMSARDRAILVGPEGAGKSMVGLQAVLAGACGLHPFTFERIPPVRGVYIDLETPEDQLAGRVERMLDAAGAGCEPGGRLAIWSRDGEWMRLSGTRDQHRLAGVFRRHFGQGGGEPRLVVAGPLYKLLSGKLEEDQHIAVAAFWNRVITRWDCALWLEAHAPMSQGGKRDWRPMASGVWTRWPEVGRWMRPVKNEHRTWQLPGFRDHDRDDLEAPRCWPETIWWRTAGSGWPWGGTYDPAAFQAPMFTPAAAREAYQDAAEERAEDLGRRRAAATTPGR
jgi:hypothetical protein